MALCTLDWRGKLHIDCDRRRRSSASLLGSVLEPPTSPFVATLLGRGRHHQLAPLRPLRISSPPTMGNNNGATGRRRAATAAENSRLIAAASGKAQWKDVENCVQRGHKLVKDDMVDGALTSEQNTSGVSGSEVAIEYSRFAKARGQTALHAAAAAGKPRIVQVLLSAGWDSQARNSRNLTPGELAWQNGHDEVQEILGVQPKDATTAAAQAPSAPSAPPGPPGHSWGQAPAIPVAIRARTEDALVASGEILAAQEVKE